MDINNNVISKNIHWLLRIILAVTFLNHGYPKLGQEVANLGYLGYLIGPFEFFGGIFIIIGPFIPYMLTRIGGMMMSIIMIGAIYMHIFTWQDKGFLELEWQLLLLSVSLFFVFKGDEA